ncbi:unnamed protein product [Blepharisma stoltei]|uniref:protein-tyrosine-phosphatase n=1 Tax=Blepharisma stoltei TaxID=1481888 RepID=A0AAU9JU07_9CILI|nr:unnamed protein product [Blepharisma stoltei]
MENSDLERFQEDIHEIENGLYLGSQIAAENLELLQSLGIKNIVQVLEYQSDITFPGITYHFVQINDLESENMIPLLPEALKFISSSLLSGQKVLVHCAAGRSRSATIVIAYIMAKHRLNFEQAHNLVQSRRLCIYPNFGFRRQLKQVGSDLLSTYLIIN